MTTTSSPSPDLPVTTTDAPMEVDGPRALSDEEDDDYGFSQLPSPVPFTQLAQETLDKSRSFSTPVTVNTTAPTSRPKAGSSTRSWSQSFQEAGKNSKSTFCFDVAHRDILALKADALAAASHGGAKGAKGIQARKFAPEMVSV